ncbi:MAG TPA: cytochrome o ubiquinol oxidase subunit III [Candidatus Saccharimonadales bacterium]|jgi:cytochrome o ubiquinol oxidase subunit 3
MSHKTAVRMTAVPEPAVPDQFKDKAVFGFWVYLMTDLVLFATLFATYAILHDGTNGGPDSRELFNMLYVLVETLLLLTSSFTCGLAWLSVVNRNKLMTLIWFGLTFLLGAAFLAMEIAEFRTLLLEGHSWRSSGFLSGFFTLVGTHGLHIASGLLWMGVLLVTLMRRGFTSLLMKRFMMLSLFWHMLDVVWIFIFTVVYLIGVV